MGVDTGFDTGIDTGVETVRAALAPAWAETSLALTEPQPTSSVSAMAEPVNTRNTFPP